MQHDGIGLFSCVTVSAKEATRTVFTASASNKVEGQRTLHPGCEHNFFSHYGWDVIRGSQFGSRIPASRVRGLYTRGVYINYIPHRGSDIVRSDFSLQGMRALHPGCEQRLYFSVGLFSASHTLPPNLCFSEKRTTPTKTCNNLPDGPLCNFGKFFNFGTRHFNIT